MLQEIRNQIQPTQLSMTCISFYILLVAWMEIMGKLKFISEAVTSALLSVMDVCRIHTSDPE
jgi:hypothetical protein